MSKETPQQEHERLFGNAVKDGKIGGFRLALRHGVEFTATSTDGLGVSDLVTVIAVLERVKAKVVAGDLDLMRDDIMGGGVLSLSVAKQ